MTMAELSSSLLLTPTRAKPTTELLRLNQERNLQRSDQEVRTHTGLDHLGYTDSLKGPQTQLSLKTQNNTTLSTQRKQKQDPKEHNTRPKFDNPFLECVKPLPNQMTKVRK